MADKGSIRSEPEGKTIWVYTVVAHDLPDGTAILATKSTIDCRREEYKDTFAMTYRITGENISSKSLDGGWQATNPETNGQELIDLVCEGKGDTFGANASFTDMARMARGVLKGGAAQSPRTP